MNDRYEELLNRREELDSILKSLSALESVPEYKIYISLLASQLNELYVSITSAKPSLDNTYNIENIRGQIKSLRSVINLKQYYESQLKSINESIISFNKG